jgi:hypothetical protein
LEETCRRLAADRGLSDTMSMRFSAPPLPRRPGPACSSSSPSWSTAPQKSGQLRADLTLEDRRFLNRANSRILQEVRVAGAAAWRRHLGLLLDGLRAERAYPLPRRRCYPG